MKAKKALVSGIVAMCMATSVWVFYSVFTENIVFFYTPSEFANPKTEAAYWQTQGTINGKPKKFRLGGIVKKNSLTYLGDANSTVLFKITDGKAEIKVRFQGIPPDLFGEGRGVVAEGSMDVDRDGVFIATRLLAKHDENYKPPETGKR